MPEETYVFLHGLGASHQQFNFAEKTAPEAASLLMVDFPGHGENGLTEGIDPSFDSFAELLCALCDHLDIRQARFVGLSMGAAVSLICAIRQPDLVQHLVLIRPSWLASVRPKHLALIDRCGEWLAQNDPRTALTQLEADADYREMVEDVPLAAASVRGVFDRAHAVAHAPTLRSMYQDRPFAALSELRSVQVPAIVIGSHADSLHPIAIANATANALPKGTLQILPPRYLRPQDHADALSTTIFNTNGVAA